MLEAHDDGSNRIRNVKSGLSFDISGGSHVSKAKLIQWDAHNGNN